MSEVIAPHNSVAGAAGLELVRCDDDALTAGRNPRTDFITKIKETAESAARCSMLTLEELVDPV